MFQTTNQRNKLSLAASDSFPFTTHLNLSPTKVEAVLRFNVFAKFGTYHDLYMQQWFES